MTGAGPHVAVVTGAGVLSIPRVPDREEAVRDRLIDTSLKGSFLTGREFLPAMIAAHGGCIVNIASTAASAAAVSGPGGVRVNRACPGLIDTEMADWIREDPAALDRWAATVPARRIGTPAEIAAAVAYLASDGASYLQGTVLMADGGVTA